MLYDVDWAEDGTYRPGEKNSPEKFFNDGLKNSCEFDLQLGYFSSAAISVLAEGFATFVANGGRMRLVINQIVSEADKKAINKGMNGTFINCFNLTDFESLRKTFDEYQQQFFDCLAFLIYNKRIDIRIIRPRNRKGIAHTKSGQFRDGDSVTSFTGSANFTISGLFNNLEEIKIDRSDSIDTMVRARIKSQRAEFDAIMNGQKRGIDYLSADKLEAAVASSCGGKDIDELLDVERKLKRIKAEKEIRRMNENNECVHDDCEVSAPHFPYPSGPRNYQKQAFENWKNNGQRGLFAMATGTGKTITSLNCLLEIYKRKGYYKAIILVPTQTLVEQWEKECRKFNFKNIYKVYSRNKMWKNEIETLHLKEEFNYSGNNFSFVIVSTYASFARTNVFKSLNGFSASQTLLIADEAHNMGAGRILDRLDGIKYIRRIGLSATPNRQYDDVANRRLAEFFGCAKSPTFEFSMREAIDQGFLCRYYYYPHVIYLNDEEMAEYIKISLQLAKYFNYDSSAFPQGDDILMALLLKRKRIVHKAKNKEVVFLDILKQRYKEKGNLKYTLVYVPEGNKLDETSDVFDAEDSIGEDATSQHLIDRYTEIVKSISRTMTVREFTSSSKDREKILSDFASGDLEVLTSMKCLDEGVDVPRSEMAIFCASTGNPRQFIQRRGRILRKHKDKYHAVIHDLIVAPLINSASASYNMERRLLEMEMKRVRDFASLSENADFTYTVLDEITTYYNITIL